MLLRCALSPSKTSEIGAKIRNFTSESRSLPQLPKGAAWIQFSNRRRNALSLEALKSIKSQILQANTNQHGKLTLLPHFKRENLPKKGENVDEFSWLFDSNEWRKCRDGLPTVLVISTEGPVFSSGHDLAELKGKSKEEITETFDLCAEVMELVRRAPQVVVTRVQGLATAAGAQLVSTSDLSVALSNASFGTPGVKIGLYCTTPGVAVGRVLPHKSAFQMLATGRGLSAQMALQQGMISEVVEASGDVEKDLSTLDSAIVQLASEITSSAGQVQALGKWAFWTQLGIQGEDTEGGGDGMEDAVKWAGQVMARNSQLDDAKEGFAAFLEKRKPSWKT